MTPGTPTECRHDLIADFFQLVEVVADDLHRVLSLHARENLQDVVANDLGEVPIHARHRLVELGADFGDQFGLGAGALATQPSVTVDFGRPLGLRLERHEELGAVEASRIDARIGSPQLANDRFDLGVLTQDGAGQPGLLGILIERNADRKDAANPDVPFFQRRNELASQVRQQQDRKS